MSVTNLPREPWAIRLRKCQKRRGQSTSVAKSAAGPETEPDTRPSPCGAPAFAAQGRNLLFACYPVRLARELLGLDVARMASQFGYSKTEWMRIEANLLALSPQTCRRIEDFVRDSLADDCRL